MINGGELVKLEVILYPQVLLSVQIVADSTIAKWYLFYQEQSNLQIAWQPGHAALDYQRKSL